MLLMLLSWVACVSFLYGLKLIGDKNQLGFYVACVAEGLWLLWGLATHSYALVGLSIALLLMTARNIWAWARTVEDEVMEDVSDVVTKL